MIEPASACRITRANQWAITSENPKFDLDEFNKWLHDHGEHGFFVRVPGDTFDCKYMSDIVFDQMYEFEPGDEDALFRPIIKK